jgi:hypothetical protein
MPTRKPDRIAAGIEFRYDSVMRHWCCQTCGAAVHNYLKHGEWHARLNEAVQGLRRLVEVYGESADLLESLNQQVHSE